MSYCAVQGELCSLTSHLGLQVCYIVSFCCLYSFSPWTVVSPSIEGFLSAPSRVLSPLDRSSCLLHQVSAHRERPMEIRMNEFKRVSCLGLRCRKGIGMHLARQTG